MVSCKYNRNKAKWNRGGKTTAMCIVGVRLGDRIGGRQPWEPGNRQRQQEANSRTPTSALLGRENIRRRLLSASCNRKASLLESLHFQLLVPWVHPVLGHLWILHLEWRELQTCVITEFRCKSRFLTPWFRVCTWIRHRDKSCTPSSSKSHHIWLFIRTTVRTTVDWVDESVANHLTNTIGRICEWTIIQERRFSQTLGPMSTSKRKVKCSWILPSTWESHRLNSTISCAHSWKPKGNRNFFSNRPSTPTCTN